MLSGSVPIPIVGFAFAVVAIATVINVVFVGQPWLDKFNMFCWIAGPAAIIGLLFLFLFNDKCRNLLQVKQSADPSRYQQIGTRRLVTSAVRPEVYGESYNAKINAKDTTSALLTITPLWRYHLIACVLAIPVATGLLFTALVGFINPADPEVSALLPSNPIVGFFATIDPGFKPFIGLFGLASLALLLNGLRKPLRKVEFHRSTNQCTIHNQWILGLISKEALTVNSNDIEAIQLVSYTDKEAATRYTHQTGKSRGFSSNSPVREYEINLALNDGQRINIVNHRSKRAIIRDAAALQDWLAVPLVDQINA